MFISLLDKDNSKGSSKKIEYSKKNQKAKSIDLSKIYKEIEIGDQKPTDRNSQPTFKKGFNRL